MIWKWFDPRNFCDTYQEWHALVEGFASGFCINKGDYWPNDELLNDLMSEHHYYDAGRALGRASLIVLIAGMIVWIV